MPKMPGPRPPGMPQTHVKNRKTTWVKYETNVCGARGRARVPKSARAWVQAGPLRRFWDLGPASGPGADLFHMFWIQLNVFYVFLRIPGGLGPGIPGIFFRIWFSHVHAYDFNIVFMCMCMYVCMCMCMCMCICAYSPVCVCVPGYVGEKLNLHIF